jgi:hypothetical protein
MNARIGLRLSVVFVLVLGAWQVPARAGVNVFTGTDVGAGPGSADPNAAAAAASFTTAAAAIGNVGVITFESAPVGSFSSLVVAPGVTISGADQNGNNQQILNSPNFPGNPALDGFNTTPGGSNYVEMIGGSLNFTFATPTQFFGAYITGVQSVFYSDVITFSDGTSQTVNITNPDPSAGGITFVGFTDPGKLLTSLQIYTGPQSGADYVGVDDVSYQAAVPEPGSMALCLISMVAGGVTLARRRRAAE